MKMQRLFTLIFSILVLGAVWLLGCDTWVALHDSTAQGIVLFAKNSDRLIFSSQPIVFKPRRSWEKGVKIDLGRISIPQVSLTYATLGSSPYWCWGYEEGINEYGVVIGNEGVFTKPLREAVTSARAGKNPEPGPTGMDLLRLGLERGKTAREALEVIAGLVEEYGQFGSGMPTMGIEGAYDNSYIIADPREAWILETAGRQWAARKVSRGTASISNTLSIGADWDLSSGKLQTEAVRQGWWPGHKTPFHFAEAYTDDTPLKKAQAQRARTRARCSQGLMQKKQGRITPSWMRQIARDRSTSPSLDLDVTASSSVAELHPPDKGLPVFWWCPSVPSSGCFIPFFVHGLRLPEAVSKAGTAGKSVTAPSRAEKDTFLEESLWWVFRDLTDKVNMDRPTRLPIVRAAFDKLEQDFAEGLTEVAEQALTFRQKDKKEEAGRILDQYSQACVDQALAKANELRRLFAEKEVEPPPMYSPFIGTLSLIHI